MDKNILFLTPRFGPDKGGLARASLRVAQILTKIGYRVTIVKLINAETTGELVQDYSAISIIEHNFKVFKISLKQDEISNRVNYILDKLKNKNFYLIISFYLNMSSYIGIQLKKSLNIPIVASAQGSDINVNFFKSDNLTRHMFQEIFHFSDHIVFVSDDQRKKALFYYGEIRNKSSVIPNSFAPQQYKNRKVRLGYPIDKKLITIGSVGELSYKKGTDLLFPCLERIKKELNANILLIGNYNDQTILSKQYLCTGPIDSELILNYVRLLDIILFSSRVEGCPIALIEAMALGKIVVANNIPALREIIADSKNGFLVDFSYPDKVLRLVKKLTQNKYSYKYISVNAKKTIKYCFNIDREIVLWRTLCSSLLNN